MKAAEKKRVARLRARMLSFHYDAELGALVELAVREKNTPGLKRVSAAVAAESACNRACERADRELDRARHGRVEVELMRVRFRATDWPLLREGAKQCLRTPGLKKLAAVMMRVADAEEASDVAWSRLDRLLTEEER